MVPPWRIASQVIITVLRPRPFRRGSFMMLHTEMGFVKILWTSYWVWWLHLFFSFISPVYSLTSPCQQSLIDQCGRLITGFSPQKYLSGLIPDSAIKDDCDAFASVRLCNDKVLRPCLAAELITLDPFIRQANEFVTLFCENEQFRRGEYLNYDIPCFF